MAVAVVGDERGAWTQGRPVVWDRGWCGLNWTPRLRYRAVASHAYWVERVR